MNPELKNILTKKDFKNVDNLNSYLLDAGYEIDEVVDITDELFGLNQLKDTKRDIAFKKLEIIIRTLNEGWIPDFNDSSQKKYYNYFRIINGVFSYYITGYSYNDMTVGSALYFKSEGLAKYAANKYINLYREYYENDN